MPNIPGSPRADVPGTAGRGARRAATGDRVTDEACAGLQPGRRASRRAQRGAAGWRTGRARAGPAEFRRPGRHASSCPLIRTPKAPLADLAYRRKAAAAAAVAATARVACAAAYTGTLPCARPAVRARHDRAPSPQPSHRPAPLMQPSHRPGTPQPSRRPGTAQATPARRCRGLEAIGPAAVGGGTAYAPRRRMARHPRRRWRSATWRRQPAARPRSPPTAQRTPHPGTDSPASRPRPPPTRPADPASHRPGSHRHPAPYPPGLLLPRATTH